MYVSVGTEPREISIASPYPESTPFYNLIMIAHMEKNHERMRELVVWKLEENPQHPLALMAGYYVALISGDGNKCEQYSTLIFSLESEAGLNEDYSQFMDLFKLHQQIEPEEFASALAQEEKQPSQDTNPYAATNWLGNIAVAVSSELARNDPNYQEEMTKVGESWIETRTKHILDNLDDDELVSIARQLIEEERKEGAVDMRNLPHPFSELFPIEVVCVQSEVRVLLWKMVNASVGLIITLEKNTETVNDYYPTKRLSENLLWFQTQP